MADAHSKRKTFGRSASTESTEYSITMGRSIREKKKKPKERWLLTRKTWRYMADAGRKLIPDGAQNRPEDIPKIEAYFQEVCKKEPRFLLWRKNSYPGAIGFRKKKRKAGSCRKAASADSVDIIKPERPKDLAIAPLGSGKFDLKKMKEEFLNKPPSPINYVPFVTSRDQDLLVTGSTKTEQENNQLISMLEQYLTLSDQQQKPSTSKGRGDLDYQELVDKLQRHLAQVSRTISSSPNYSPKLGGVQFEGNYVQKLLSETLSRHFSQSTNREKVISDLLTDRKALEKLYFELRKTKGFRGSRGGTGYTSQYGVNPSANYRIHSRSYNARETTCHPPPLIEIENETFEATYSDYGTQTLPIPEEQLQKIEEEFKRIRAEQEEEDRRDGRSYSRRRSSVDNDDISQSVSDTIKRYLRMARKKSVDSDKADRFKRVNYDRNLRNIKAKGEITKPGDDDGLNKGCQTNDDWILTYRDLKFDEILSDESRFSSSRSSIDIGEPKSSPSSPPQKTQSFLSHLLHGKHEKHEKHDKNERPSSSAAGVSGAAMQKSKSSSSVVHHGSRLMAKKIFKSRSKSQTRPPATSCNWTPQGSCVWNSLSGRQVILGDDSLLHLSEIERKVLQKVALAKLQALNLGVSIKVPTENIGATPAKAKRRPYLLKRKAITTGIFDSNRKEGEKDKENQGPSGLVFGIPLTQCVENDRLSRAASCTTGAFAGGGEDGRIRRHGSRSSFSSLIDTTTTGEESSSFESLMGKDRIASSVPGLLDALSSTSTTDLRVNTSEEENAVPSILTACIRHLEQYGLHTLGIFRVSTSKKRIRQLKEEFDSGKETTLDNEQCPHDAATLLKEYLRELPDPLLCRDLYLAFVQTQKIRNRRLQFEALQHLIQLLPAAHRDTLHALLSFLANVARYANDRVNEAGETIPGNKMDSTNLATVFAPNILHCIKPNSSKESISDKPEDRIDVINVVRTLIDHYRELFVIPAELLDEVYLHMMDSYPEALNDLLAKKETSSAADESVEELDSESYSAPWTPVLPTASMSIEQAIEAEADLPHSPTEPKKTWSREECLHESAATGGPNISMRIRHKDRIKERSSRRKREESASRRRKEEDSNPTMAILSRLRSQRDDDYQFGKNRSSSMESSSSTHTDYELSRALRLSEGLDERRKSSPYLLENAGVIKASLTIPVQTTNHSIGYNLEDDIPYIEEGDGGKQQLTIGMIKTSQVPHRGRQQSISGSDSSIASNIQPITGSLSLVQGYDSAVGSSTAGSTVQNTPTSISSSIADAGVLSSPPSWASSPPTSPDSTHTSVNYIPDDNQFAKPRIHKIITKESPTIQRVTFSTTKDIQTKPREIKIVPVGATHQEEAQRQAHSSQEIRKSSSASVFEGKPTNREPKVAASISNIGNAVLRSKTADFERITKADTKSKTTTTTTSSDKKKYTKRRYTDSRHPTKHIPDSESLENSSSSTKKENRSSSQPVPVYKRRELISSVPPK